VSGGGAITHLLLARRGATKHNGLKGDHGMERRGRRGRGGGQRRSKEMLRLSRGW